MLRIQVTGCDDTPRELTASTGPMRIGREPGRNDLVFEDPFVSGRHGVLETRAGGWCYRDLGSSNGSYLMRGQERTAVHREPFLEIPLQKGDRIQLGDPEKPVTLEVRELVAPAGAVRSEADLTVLATRSIPRDGEAEPAAAVGEGEYGRLFLLLRGLIADADSPDWARRFGGAAVKAFPQATHFVFLERLEGTGDRLAPQLCLARAPEGVREADPEVPRAWKASLEASKEVHLYEEFAEPASAGAAGTPERAGRFGMAAGLRDREGKLLGAVFLENREAPDRPFTEKDLELFSFFVGQAAVVLENRFLYASLRKREARLQGERSYLRARVGGGMIGKSKAIREVMEFLDRVAASAAPLLLEGETGVGKEVAARYLHDRGPRREGMFCALNCSALPDNLLESELFGYRKGAFTGALKDKKGLADLADGGTLFLDEIGEMSPRMQVKLLRFLEEKEYVPLGGTKVRRVHVRVVAATNRNLEQSVREGDFREDLFWRINTLQVKIPPLRERKADIPVLANHFMEHFGKRDHKPGRRLSPETVACLKRYAFPGNVRELRNEIERALTLADSEEISPDLLSGRLIQGTLAREESREVQSAPLGERVSEVERNLLRLELVKANWNISKAARNLGLTRHGLKKKMSRLGVEKP